MASSNAVKEMWISFALAGAGQVQVPDNIEDEDEAADYLVDFSTKFADSMLDEWEARFGGGGAKKRRSKSKRKSAPDEDGDDDDDDDDDDD
jgi:hypothetical protein